MIQLSSITCEIHDATDAQIKDSSGNVIVLDYVSGPCSIDEGRSPYAQASIIIARPKASTFAYLDPALGNRVLLKPLLTQYTGDPNTTGPGSQGLYRLLITDRTLNDDGTVSLELRGDDQFLIDYSPTAVDTSNKARQSSVKSIITAVLAKVFGTAPSVNPYLALTDATFPTFSALTNLIPNPSFENDAAGWTGGNATLSSSSDTATGWPKYGTRSLKITPTGSGTTSYAQATLSNLTPGGTYTLSGTYFVGKAQSASAPARARTLTAWVTINGVLTFLAQSAQATNTAQAQTGLSVTFTLPQYFDSVSVIIYNGVTDTTNSTYVDGIMLLAGNGLDTDGVTPVGYFDGSTTATSAYTYSWQSTAGSSSSTRTPVVQRDPEILTWSPGQSAFDFLEPILQVVGWRLWCNESRSWYLADNQYVNGFHLGTAHFDAGNNLYGFDDKRSREDTNTDGSPYYCDAVVIKYTWTDGTGATQTAWDVATASTSYTKPYYIEKTDTPFPGVGAATYLLGRYRSRRLQLSLTARPDYTVSTGQPFSSTYSPTLPTQTGYIDAVTFDPAACQMTVATKNPVATVASAWQNQTTTWAATTGTWASHT